VIYYVGGGALFRAADWILFILEDTVSSSQPGTFLAASDLLP
jgi:hypothetical protein